jgi:hypothetical protein
MRGCDSEEWPKEKDWWEETLGEAERKQETERKEWQS